jgi:hypothetical protein
VIRMLVKQLGTCDYEPVSANSLRFADAKISSSMFDIVLPDVHLMDWSGLDLLPPIRESQIGHHNQTAFFIAAGKDLIQQFGGGEEADSITVRAGGQAPGDGIVRFSRAWISKG